MLLGHRKCGPMVQAEPQLLPVVAAAADGVVRAPEREEDDSDNEQDDSERLDDGDLGDQTDDQENDSEDDHVRLLPGA